MFRNVSIAKDCVGEYVMKSITSDEWLVFVAAQSGVAIDPQHVVCPAEALEGAGTRETGFGYLTSGGGVSLTTGHETRPEGHSESDVPSITALLP